MRLERLNAMESYILEEGTVSLEEHEKAFLHVDQYDQARHQ